jgi:hypothetical protein
MLREGQMRMSPQGTYNYASVIGMLLQYLQEYSRPNDITFAMAAQCLRYMHNTQEIYTRLP